MDLRGGDNGLNPVYKMIESNSFIVGDCLEVLRGMPDKCVDLCLTDPPYGVGIEYKSYDDTENNWFDLMGNRGGGGVLKQMIRVSRMLIMPCCRIKALPWIYKNYPPDWLIAWYKGSPGHSSFIGFNDWEPLLVYGKNDGIQMHDYMCMNNTEIMGGNGHPCPKPLLWAEWIINRASFENNLILDPFAGSCTTAIACHKTGRRFICIDIEPEYIAIGKKRYAEALAQGELFTPGTLEPQQEALPL